MGFDLNRFTKQVDKGFLCTICGLVFENAVESQHCLHIYCKQCIETWLKTNAVCPIDTIALKPEQVTPIPINLRNLVLKLEIKCDFESEGCKTVVTLENLVNHVKSCSFDPNSLINCLKECGLELTRKEYRNHNCLSYLAESVMLLQTTNTKLSEEVSELKRKQLWYTCYDGINVHKNNLIECAKDENGYARSPYSLNEHYSYFELKIVELGTNFVCIGLSFSPKVRQDSKEPIYKHFIYYGCKGMLSTYSGGNETNENIGSKWKIGDYIGCGIKFPKSNYHNENLVIYFKHNNTLIAEKTLSVPEEGLIPTVFMKNKNERLEVVVN